MTVVEMLGLTLAIFLAGYLARNMLELGSSAERFRPVKPCDPRLLRDPITMSWEDTEHLDPQESLN